MLTKLEIKRQLVHAFLGISIVILLYFDLINAAILFAIFILGLMLSFLSKKTHIPMVYSLLKTFDREKDLKQFPGKGAVFYVLGAFLVVLVFPEDAAMASIMILALGDSVSRLVGPYGYLKHPFHNEKFFEGAIGGAIAAFLGALFFVSWLPALIASSASMLLEGLDLRIKNFKIDDNLMIPIVAATIIQSTSILF